MSIRKIFMIVFLSVSGCGSASEAALEQPLSAYRCERDGICITKKSADLFSGAFREKDMEIEFDIAYRPSLENRMKGGGLYCSRLVLEGKHRYYLGDNSHCPRSWHEMNSEAFIHERFQALAAYPDVARQMREELNHLEIPDQVGVAQWEELKHIVEAVIPTQQSAVMAR